MLMDTIKARHSIRKYTNEQIKREDLDKILEAGNYAPNAGGGQRSMMVAVNNAQIISRGEETFAGEEGKKLMKEWDVRMIISVPVL